eukprot:CAMPEP_0197023510 /NCGR_PEP_ID=MMETSP1384-20130603/4181_1 /TAXON_ID=29189 /ORGANISM="Ammonia sp." /LENGTH=245 /DNA_ID=CAMNT_0042451727 /DNA_START=57 /DNA_END=794 /DNA_ORIENTATION=+
MYVHQPASSQSMAANGGCHITKGATNRKKSKSPAPNKKLPPNNKKPQNAQLSNNSPITKNNSNNNNTAPNNVYSHKNSPNSNASSSSSNKSVQKQPKQYKIAPKSPKSNAHNANNNNVSHGHAKPVSGNVANSAMAVKPHGMPLAKPQKMATYYMPPNFAYNHHDDHKHQGSANAHQPFQAGNKEKHRVKNRPAQFSIADKLLAQQNAEELERMAEEEEERELKLKAKQMGGTPLQSASTYKVKK